MTWGNFCPDTFKNNDPPFQRCSKDTHINVNGHDLLALCSSFDLYILNGTCERDTSGQYTYISTSGNSVIDYFVFSRFLCSLPHKMLVLERIDSKHMPITCSVRWTEAIILPLDTREGITTNGLNMSVRKKSLLWTWTRQLQRYLVTECLQQTL